MWQDSPSSFPLTPLDRRDSVEGQCIARMAFQGRDGDLPFDLSIHQQVVEVPTDIEFLQWECDHVFYPLSDYFVSLFDMATEHHPLVLILFTLDVSRLSEVGISAVQSILCRSRLCISVFSAQSST